jgi:CrcB protein
VTLLLITVGAVLGAPLRYLTDRAIQARHDSVFPWGTLTVNAAGSLILGMLFAGVAAGDVPSAVMTTIGTGVCGALTTYSTFGYETIRLIDDGSYLYAGLNITTSVVAGLGAASLGWAIASAIWT